MSKKKKTYKKKYYTGGRVDMSKGGRVKAQTGGKFAKAPVKSKVPPMSIEREEEIRPTVQPTRPIQLKPVLSPPPKGSNGRMTAKQEAELANLNVSGNQIIPNVSTGNQQTATTPEEAAAAKAGLTLEEYRARQLENLDNKITNVFPRRPNFIGEKGSDQMFIGREGEVRPQQAQSKGSGLFGTMARLAREQAQTTQAAQAQAQSRQASTTPMSQADFFKQYGKFEGNIRQRKTYENWQNNRQKAYEDYINSFFNSIGGGAGGSGGSGGSGGAGETPTTPTPEELAAQEKTRQQDVARQSVEAAARGEVPEAAQIPDAVQVGYQRDAQGQLLLDDQGNPIPLKEQQVTTMDPVTRARTDIRAEGQAPEQVTTVGEAATAKTPEQIRAETITDDDLTLVPEEAQVEAATGEVSDQAIAEAAQVDRVAPIEGAEVEIPEGALAERVVGTISEGAKATAAMNVGTSLSRITRAKKQLSRAGLSDADIEEIGNDPEALEDRLADFSEEQRGIIEGLPQEALVSTQMNNLLEGIESGEIPTWARPAVAQVEQMLARRGMSASTVGRDSLFNAIIQSAMPIAQSNAQAIQQSVSQQKTIEAQTAEANAQRMQQTALTNAQNVFQMDMSQFSADQQTALSNSKFLQTVGLAEASNEQQATIQNAVLMSQANLAEADFYQKAQIQNAQAFLQMDVQNLANEQQANVLKAQQTQQRMLSNQSAQNAAAQFNAASENQTQQFMTSLNAQIDQYNTSQMNAVAQFDAAQKNAAAARDAQRAADVEKFNTQLETQIDQFNANQDFARNQWNAQNRAVVEQSNTQWRRNMNTANTAMQNQINAQNAQNAFAMSQTAQSFLWQELRDQADYDFRNSENEKNRIAQLVNTALASDPKKYGGSVASIEALIGAITGDIF
jgi:hypothetical protein